MPAKKLMLMFTLALTTMVALPTKMVNASDLRIQTRNVDMWLSAYDDDDDDDDEDVVIRTAPVRRPVIVNPNVNRNININRNRNYRTRAWKVNNQMKCRSVSQRRNSTRGGNQIYTSTISTTCS